jgi:hypothetical protein
MLGDEVPGVGGGSSRVSSTSGGGVTARIEVGVSVAGGGNTVSS